MKAILPKDELARSREEIHAGMRRPGIEGKQMYKTLIAFIGEPANQLILRTIHGGVPLAMLLNVVITLRWAQLPLLIFTIGLAVWSDPRWWWGAAACVLLWINLNALQVRLNIEIAARLDARARQKVA